MNICIVAGARPNFIKVAPIIHVIQKEAQQGHDISCQLVYAGRDDDPTLEDSLFDDLEIRRPDVFLGVDCENLNELTGQVMSAFERYLQAHSTDAVIVVDDLASTMAAAIVTKKQGIPLAHLVAGTRSFDISMPKEINRLVIDGLSDLLFTAGIGSQSTATREGSQEKVYMVGNILMDTLRHNRKRWQMPEIGLPERYIVFTINRKALLSNRQNLADMLRAITANAAGTKVIAPLRASAADIISEVMADYGMTGDMSFMLCQPLSYLQFCWLTAHATGIITDSGNVAEEATFNGVPCITLNSYTEHIETVKVGTNILVGEDPDMLGRYVAQMARGEWKRGAIPDRWDGRSAERIVRTLLEKKP